MLAGSIERGREVDVGTVRSGDGAWMFRLFRRGSSSALRSPQFWRVPSNTYAAFGKLPCSIKVEASRLCRAAE